MVLARDMGPPETGLVRFCLVRIDDRLIHGQVVLNWVRVLRPRRIAVVDDEIGNDPLSRSLIQLAAPAHIDSWVGPVVEAPAALLDDPRHRPETTLILVPSISPTRCASSQGMPSR